MQPGEGKRQIGDPLEHTYYNLTDRRPYRLLYCPECKVLHKENTDEGPSLYDQYEGLMRDMREVD